MKHQILLTAACKHAFSFPEIINHQFDLVATGDIELRGHEHQTATLPWSVNFENTDLKGLLFVHPSLMGKIHFLDAAFVVDGFDLHENRQLTQITVANNSDEPLRIRVGTPLARVFVSGHSIDDELVIVAKFEALKQIEIIGDGSGISLPEIGNDGDTVLTQTNQIGDDFEVESIEPAIDVPLDQVDVAATIADTEGDDVVLSSPDSKKADSKKNKRATT